ncbi:MAG: SPOR domain-containing protein [Candidatus Omnitrophota bacterium]
MEEDNQQKEFFELDKPKRSFPGFGRIFQKTDLERKFVFTLTLEKTVFIAIGIIMAMVVVYALGVEAGKSIKGPKTAAYSECRAKAAVSVAEPHVRTVKLTRGSTSVPPPQNLSTAAGRKSLAVNAAARQPKAQAVVKPYTIIAVTLTRRDTAMQEVERLRKEGISAYIVPSGKYFQVRTGSYQSAISVQAKQDLIKVRRQFKDAYLKQL